MKINLKFEPKDFETFKNLEKAVARQLGNTVYVGADSLCLYFDYPKELLVQLRPKAAQWNEKGQLAFGVPYLEKDQYEFDLTSSKPEKT